MLALHEARLQVVVEHVGLHVIQLQVQARRVGRLVLCAGDERVEPLSPEVLVLEHHVVVIVVLLGVAVHVDGRFKALVRVRGYRPLRVHERGDAPHLGVQVRIPANVLVVRVPRNRPYPNLRAGLVHFSPPSERRAGNESRPRWNIGYAVTVTVDSPVFVPSWMEVAVTVRVVAVSFAATCR